MTNDQTDAMREAQEYYLRNINAGYLGNSFMWWAKGGHGYTAYLNNAERFSEAEAMAKVSHSREKWKAYRCDEVDQKIQYVFDSQDERRLGTSECGFANTVDTRPQQASQQQPVAVDVYLVTQTIANLDYMATKVDKEIRHVVEHQANLLRQALSSVPVDDGWIKITRPNHAAGGVDAIPETREKM
jgi:hypothetical protein